MNRTLLGWALYISEVWYRDWDTTRSLYARTRGIVAFDRVITSRIKPKDTA